MQNDPDTDPQAPPPRYLILRNFEAPSGYLAVANFDHVTNDRQTLLVPRKLAVELDAAWRPPEVRRSEPRASATSDATAAGAPARSSGYLGTSSVFGDKRRTEHAVDATTFTKGWPRPRGRGWVRLWDPDRMQAAVEQHNQGLGSADRHDLARDAATLRRVLELGPWRRCAVPRDGEAVVRLLEDEFGHLGDLVRLVAERLALSQASRQPFALPPVLLVGPPGVGKSHFALRLAEVLGLPSRCIDMGGQQTNGHLHGSDRHWGNARPGLLFELLVTAGGLSKSEMVANPVVILDELDKCHTSERRYDPIAPLHLALEPGTARRTRDLCANLEFDTSRVIYVATANTLEGLPDSLLSRFQIVLCEPPGARAALSVARRIADEVLAQAGLARRFAPIDRTVLALLADHTPRSIAQRMTAAVARAVTAGRQQVLAHDLEPRPSGSWLH